MSRTSEIYLCALCEGTAAQWVGRCPHCGEWNTLTARVRGAGATVGSSAVSLRLVDGGDAAPMPTGVDELDRVLGGGVVAGSVTLVFGPPGVGKSTLLFQVLASVASTEVSVAQVAGRATRVAWVPEALLALEGHDVGGIEQALLRQRPALMVVDSI